jgi:U3 small nucleolar RNA-associated protein 13
VFRRWIVSSGKDRLCLLWSVEHFKCIGAGIGHTDSVGSIAISQCLSSYESKKICIFSGAGDRVLKKWAFPARGFDLPVESEEIEALPLLCSIRAHDKDVNTLALSPNDSTLASGSQDKTIQIWNCHDLTKKGSLIGHKRGIWKIRYSPVEKTLVSCSGDRTVKIWSLDNYACLRTLEGHTASVLSITFVRDGRQLVSSSADGLLKLWTIKTGDCEATLDNHDDKIWAVASSDSIIVSGGSDSLLNIWSDVTSIIDAETLDKEESTLLAEQQLENDIRNKKYKEALTSSLKLGHSRKTLEIFLSLTEEPEECNSRELMLDKSKRKLDQCIRQISDIDLEKVIECLQEWNANAKFSYIAQLILDSIVRNVPRERLMALSNFASVVPGLEAYSKRHLERIERLQQASYILDYINSLMGILPPLPSVVDGVGNGNTRILKEKEDEVEIPLLFGSDLDFVASGDESDGNSDYNGKPRKRKK